MSQRNGNMLQELICFVLSVDRRIYVIKEFQYQPIVQASEAAKRSGRSLQNMSRALKELTKKGIVSCVNSEQRTWKRYILTETGKEVLKNLKSQNLI